MSSPASSLAAASPSPARITSSSGCVIKSGDTQTWLSSPLGGNGLNQILDALRLAGVSATGGSVQAGCPQLSAAESASWALASRLVAKVPVSVQEKELQRATDEIDREQKALMSTLKSPPPPPPVQPSLPPPPPPPPCTGGSNECLFDLVQSVPVYDYTTRQLATPDRRHMPPVDEAGEAATTTWDESGTIWACQGQDCAARGTSGPSGVGSTNALPAGTRVKQTRLASTLLKNMWDAWEPTLAEELRADECRYPPTDGSPVPKPAECAASAAATAAKQSHKAAVAASELHAMAAEGRGGDEAAIDEFVRLVLEPNSVKFFNLPCFRRCGDAPVCEYCGTNLCCRRGYRGYRNGAGDICRGHGGSSHRCTVIPEIDRNATAKAQYARALAARLILATNATQYPAPVDFSQLDEQLGLRAPAAADDAEASRSGKLSDPASAKAAASGIPSSAHGSKLKRLRAVGFPALVDELPEECRGPRNGVARWLSCRDLQPHHGGDLELPGQLEAAVAARSWRPGQGERRELVLTYANEIGTAWVANMVLSLRSVGIEHSLVISTSGTHCDALFSSPQRISCGWTSWQVPGCARKNAVRTLWYLRHHYMVRLIALGVNTLALDGDITLQGNPYAVLKALPLSRHTLLYSLDHRNMCDEVNIGFMYCNNCSDGGRAQWIVRETIRREQSFCSPNAAATYGDSGTFFNATDAAGVTAPPHTPRRWTSAQDQKVMSDVLASSCCGRPVFRKLIPYNYKLLDKGGFAKAFYPTDDCHRMAADADGDRTAHYAPLKLFDPTPGSPDPPPETMATVPGDVISSWHGTGVGELAGWSGAWLGPHPPVFAHFVGGDASGTKVALMQALGMWRFEADEVVAHVRLEEKLPANSTDVTGVLPMELLQGHCSQAEASLCWSTWALQPVGSPVPSTQPAGAAQSSTRIDPVNAGDSLSRIRLIELVGPGSTPVLTTGAAFLDHDLKTRARLATLGALLRRVAVRPRVHCDSPWAVMQRKGFRAVWQTPGERWPFGGVGIAIGRCGGTSPRAPLLEGGSSDDFESGNLASGAEDGESSFDAEGTVSSSLLDAPPAATEDGNFCCTPIYGRHLNRRQANCIGTVHASLAERNAALLSGASNHTAAIVTISLNDIPRSSDGKAIDATRTLQLLSVEPFASASILRIELGVGDSLPSILALPSDAARRASSLFSGTCAVHTALAHASASFAELNASATEFSHDLREVGRRLARRRGTGKTLGHIVRGREDFGLGEPSADAWRHFRAWRDHPKLSKVY